MLQHLFLGPVGGGFEACSTLKIGLRLPTVEACHGMLQHLFLGPVGGGFEACSTLKIGLRLPTVEACHGMLQHLFLGPVGGGFEACSTLKIGLRLPTVEACHGMLQHLFLGPVGGGFEACSTLKIGLRLFGGKILGQNINPIPVQLFVRDGQYSWLNGASVIERTLVLFLGGNLQQPWQGQEQGYKAQPVFFFFFVVLCFDRLLVSSHCLLVSTVEPTEEGTTEPKRNKETTRSTTDLKKASGRTYVVQTPRVKVKMGNCIVLYVQFGCHQKAPS